MQFGERPEATLEHRAVETGFMGTSTSSNWHGLLVASRDCRVEKPVFCFWSVATDSLDHGQPQGASGRGNAAEVGCGMVAGQ